MIRYTSFTRRDLLESLAEQTGNDALIELLDMTSDADLDRPEVTQLLAWGRPASTGLFMAEGEALA